MPSHTPKERKKKLSKKVAVVRRENPGLSSAQAVGKAVGILRSRKKKKR